MPDAPPIVLLGHRKSRVATCFDGELRGNGSNITPKTVQNFSLGLESILLPSANRYRIAAFFLPYPPDDARGRLNQRSVVRYQ